MGLLPGQRAKGVSGGGPQLQVASVDELVVVLSACGRRELQLIAGNTCAKPLASDR
jgi:hypothetical protein